jgi:inosine-uridine nucleoside N-ribohydrolase
VHIGANCGNYAFGATVADFWGERKEKPNARIAYEVDADLLYFRLVPCPCEPTKMPIDVFHRT